eukprot:SAG22_NODE_678_length_7959_cov_8.441985_3_plen_174_part_00
MQWVAKAMELETNPACEKEHQQECVFAEVIAPYIKTPLFALQSVVDHDQVGNLRSKARPGQPASRGGGRCCDNCTTQPGVNDFAIRMSATLHSTLFSAPQHGGFIDSCVHHCGSWASQGTAHVLDARVNGTGAGDAFHDWFTGLVPGGTVWQQPVPTANAPKCDACCHPAHAV